MPSTTESFSYLEQLSLKNKKLCAAWKILSVEAFPTAAKPRLNWSKGKRVKIGPKNKLLSPKSKWMANISKRWLRTREDARIPFDPELRVDHPIQSGRLRPTPPLTNVDDRPKTADSFCATNSQRLFNKSRSAANLAALLRGATDKHAKE